MLYNICNGSIKNEKALLTNEQRELKSNITKMVYNTDNDYIINAYFNNWNEFKRLINKVFNNISKADIKEIKLVNLLNRYSINEIEYIKTI